MRRLCALVLALSLAFSTLTASPPQARALAAGPSVFGQEADRGAAFNGRLLSPVTAFGKDSRGRQLAYFVTSGNAQLTAAFQAIDVVTGERVFSQRVPEGIDSWGMTVVGQTVTFSVNTNSGARLYSWTPGTPGLVDHGKPFGGDTVWAMTSAPDGAIFVGTYPSGALWQWTGGTAVKLAVPNPGEVYARSVAADNNTVWVGSLGTGKLAAFDRRTAKVTPITIPAASTGNNTQVLNLERRGKWLMVYAKTSSNIYFYDTTTGKFSSKVVTESSGGISPVDPSGRYVYTQKSNFGLGRISLDTLDIVRSGYSAEPSPRSFAWVDLPDADYPGPTLAIAGATGTLWAYDMSHDPYLGRASVPHSKSLTDQVEGAPSEIRSLGAGPDGKVYIGGMQNPTGMRIYDPASGSFDEIVGMPQIEGFGTQGTKLFAGGYPWGQIYVYDTSRDLNYDRDTTAADDMDANPFFHQLSPSQERPFAFADLGDRIMAIGTVANKNTGGGALSFWRPGSPAKVMRNPVGDQSVVDLLKVGNVLVAGSSIHGGTGYTPTTTQAKLFTVDPSSGAVLDTVIPTFEGQTSWVSALTRNPLDGSVWGIAGANLFRAEISSTGKITLTRTQKIFANNPGYYGNDFSLHFHNGLLYAAASGELKAINPDTFVSTTLATGGITDMVAVGNSLFYVKQNHYLFQWQLPPAANWAPQLGSQLEERTYIPGPTDFWGVARPGSGVSVRIDGTRVGTVTADAQGRWRLDDVDVAKGAHEVTLSSVLGGDVSPAVTYTVDFTKQAVVPSRTAPKVSGVTGDHTGEGIADVFGVDGEGRLQFYAGTADGTFRYQGEVGTGWDQMTYLAQIADISGDRRSDLLARRGADQSLWIYAGQGNGWLSTYTQAGKNWGGMDQIIPVGDLSGSGTQYVVARRAEDGSLFRYTLTRNGLTGITQIGWHWGGMRQILGVGDFTGDGRGDVLAIRDDGTLWAYAGTADGRIGAGRQVGHGWNTFIRAFSPGDFTGDGRFDLLGQRLDGQVYAYENLNGRWGTARRVMSGTEDWKLMA